MKNFGNYKEIVKELRRLDKEMSSVQERNVEDPKSIVDLEKYIKDFSNAIDQNVQDASSMFSYVADKLALHDEEYNILQQIKKHANPEDILFDLDSKFFRDYAFIADVIELCAPKIGLKAEEQAKKIYAGMTTKNKDFAKVSKSKWIKDNVENQSSSFNYRMKVKLGKAQSDIQEENELSNQLIEQEAAERIQQMIIQDVIPPAEY